MRPSRFLVTGGGQGIAASYVEQACTAGHQVVFTGCNNPNQLYAADIADTIMAALDMRRALWPELAVFAINPRKA